MDKIITVKGKRRFQKEIKEREKEERERKVEV